jgi:hypothetical protein
MFPRQKSPIIALPLYHAPSHSHSNHYWSRHILFRKNQLTRLMALGLLSLLLLSAFFAFGGAAPLLQRDLQVNVSSGDQVQGIIQIYRGNPTVLQEIDHLIIVTGHAILLREDDYLNDEAWVLESFQRGGQIRAFVDHIRKGVELAYKDPHSLLIFTG